MSTEISFKGLPQTLQRRALEGLTASDLKIITADAAKLAGIAQPKNLQPKLIRELNSDLFTRTGIVSREGAIKLCKEFDCTNKCTALRDKMAQTMKKINEPGINYNMII